MSTSDPEHDPALQPPAPLEPAELATDPRRLGAVLAAVLDQQNRDAAANRAQARELIRAVEGLSKSHEFLGMELREERRRSRALLAALVVVPLAVIAAGAFLASTVWTTDDRLEALRSSVEKDVQDLRSRSDSEREAAARADYEARLAASATDTSALRTDLEAARAALGDERRRREAHEREVAARLAAAERDRADLTGVRAELSSLREVAGAQKARADEMTRLLADVARSATPGTDAGTARRPGSSVVTGSEVPIGPRVPPDVAEGGAGPAAPAPPTRPPAASGAEPSLAPPPDPASRDPVDLARVRTKLNSLLDGLTGATRYEVESLAGVSGTDLLGVRVVGKDADGNALRTVEAGRAEITVAEGGGIRFRFTEGRLLIAGRTAPFFDGAYTIALDGAAQPWRDSGLSCVRFQ